MELCVFATIFCYIEVVRKFITFCWVLHFGLTVCVCVCRYEFDGTTRWTFIVSLMCNKYIPLLFSESDTFKYIRPMTLHHRAS